LIIELKSRAFVGREVNPVLRLEDELKGREFEAAQQPVHTPALGE